MKIKIIISIMIMIGVALAIVFKGVEQKVINRASAQIGGGCGSYEPATYDCGDGSTCGTGIYTQTAFSYNGPGNFGVENRDVPCQGSSCGSIPNVPSTYTK